MSIHEIEVKIKELRNLQALIEEATAEAEAIKDAIKASMGESEELRAGEYKVTWKAVKAARIDTKALQVAHPEVVQQFIKETTTRRFVIA